MAILSVVAGVAYVFGMNPFAFSFNISFVFLPTLILIMAALTDQSVKRSRQISS